MCYQALFPAPSCSTVDVARCASVYTCLRDDCYTRTHIYKYIYICKLYIFSIIIFFFSFPKATPMRTPAGAPRMMNAATLLSRMRRSGSNDSVPSSGQTPGPYDSATKKKLKNKVKSRAANFVYARNTDGGAPTFHDGVSEVLPSQCPSLKIAPCFMECMLTYLIPTTYHNQGPRWSR